jgi:hypothetical protein
MLHQRSTNNRQNARGHEGGRQGGGIVRFGYVEELETEMGLANLEPGRLKLKVYEGLVTIGIGNL